MKIASYARRAMALAIALSLTAVAQAGAQKDTTKRAVSEKRIPVKKDQGIKKLQSGGEVELSATTARVDQLESLVASLQERIGLLERSNTSLASRTAATESEIHLLKDSLNLVKNDLATARAELNARTAALEQSVAKANASLHSLRYGSLFGHSGFYVGAGSGASFTMGALNDIGYRPGLNVVVPIGWSKAEVPVGIRTEWGLQTFQGRITSEFGNVDPFILSGTAMLTLHMPINAAKTNLFYVMGGGGAYHFRDYGSTTALTERLGSGKTATKWGVTGGAGLELHILGATSLFVESSFTNVFADRGSTNSSKNLQWVPLVAGITLR